MNSLAYQGVQAALERGLGRVARILALEVLGSVVDVAEDRRRDLRHTVVEVCDAVVVCVWDLTGNIPGPLRIPVPWLPECVSLCNLQTLADEGSCRYGTNAAAEGVSRDNKSRAR